jgi:MFS family permease
MADALVARVPQRGPGLAPWAFVLVFGLVSLFADMVYEGARSLIGPRLSMLGASAATIGLVAGAGDFIGYGLRVASASLVTRTRHSWAWTISGYALTVLSVPLLGATGSIPFTVLLFAGERLGKAVRSPAKDTLLSHASAATGRGKAFGVHQFMDQLGAVAGPLVVAGVLAARPGDHRLAFGVLAVPGAIVVALLVWLRSRVPDPSAFEAPAPQPTSAGTPPARLTRAFWIYVAAVAVLSCGIASFPLLAVHAETHGLVAPAMVPVLFAVAMFVEGLAGLVVGQAYDRLGARVLLAVPLAACGAAVAFGETPALLWLGVGLWGAVNGVMDSTVKAAVTELVAPTARALAFGWLSLMRGLGLLVSGALLGAAFERGAGAATAVVLIANLAALCGLAWVLVFTRTGRGARPSP